MHFDHVVEYLFFQDPFYWGCMEEIVFRNPMNGEIVTVKVVKTQIKHETNRATELLTHEIKIQGLGFLVTSLFSVFSSILTTFFLLKSSILPFLFDIPDVNVDYDALIFGISFSFLIFFFSFATLNKKFLSGNPGILKLSPVTASSILRLLRYTNGTTDIKTAVLLELLCNICLYYFYFGNQESHVSRTFLKPWIRISVESKWSSL